MGAGQVGPEVCVFKTHADILSSWDGATGAELRRLADKHGAPGRPGPRPLACCCATAAAAKSGRPRCLEDLGAACGLRGAQGCGRGEATLKVWDEHHLNMFHISDWATPL